MRVPEIAVAVRLSGGAGGPAVVVAVFEKAENTLPANARTRYVKGSPLTGSRSEYPVTFGPTLAITAKLLATPQEVATVPMHRWISTPSSPMEVSIQFRSICPFPGWRSGCSGPRAR